MLGGSTQMADGSKLVLGAAAEGSWAAGRVRYLVITPIADMLGGSTQF